MHGFFTDKKCLELVKAHGEVLDIERVAKKRFEQSGCKNRFTFHSGRDIGLLSHDSYVKVGSGDCFTVEERGNIRALSNFTSDGKRMIEPYKKNELTYSYVKRLNGLKEPKILTEEFERQNIKYKRKYAPLKDFLDNVGKGLPIPEEIISDNGKKHRVLFTRGILKVLADERAIYLTKSALFNEKGKMGLYETISVGRGSFLYPSSLPKELQRVKARIIAIPISVGLQEGFAHANILLIDRKKKEVFYFEPHGAIAYGQSSFTRDTSAFVGKFMEVFGYSEYKKVDINESCPWFGPQAKEERYGKDLPQTGYCLAWSDLFAYCKAKFPDLSEVEIHEAMLEKRSPTQIRGLVERFAAFVWAETERFLKRRGKTAQKADLIKFNKEFSNRRVNPSIKVVY